MVYEKYSKKGGKVFGPYYYVSYREGNKVKKIYIGGKEEYRLWLKEKNNGRKKINVEQPFIFKKNPTNILAIILILFASIFLIMNLLSYSSNFGFRNTFTGLSISENESGVNSKVNLYGSYQEEEIDKSFETKGSKLKIIKPAKFSDQGIFGINNHVMDFSIPDGDVKIYFDLLDYNEFVENVAQELVSKEIIKLNQNEINNENETSQEIIKDNKSNETNDSVDNNIENNQSIIQDEENTSIDNIQQDLNVENESFIDSNKENPSEDNDSFNQNILSITGNSIKNLFGFAGRAVGIDENLSEVNNNRNILNNEILEKVDLEEVKDNLDEISEEKIEEIAKNSEILAEDFDINVDTSKIYNKNPQYKWGYKIRLNNLKFMAKVKVSTNKTISIHDKQTLKIGSTFLSFSDLVKEGYNVRIESPSLGLNIKIRDNETEIINVIENETIETNISEIQGNETYYNETDSNKTYSNETSLNESNLSEIDTNNSEVQDNETPIIDSNYDNSSNSNIDTNINESSSITSTDPIETPDEVNIDEPDNSNNIPEDSNNNQDNSIDSVTNNEIDSSSNQQDNPNSQVSLDPSTESNSDNFASEPVSEPIQTGYGITGGAIRFIQSITGKVVEGLGIIEPEEALNVNDLGYSNDITIYIERDFTNSRYNVGDIIELDPYFLIIITQAEHLNSNRSFLSDIYDKVRTLDNIWSEEIPIEDYVRVVFQHALTNVNDITIHARSKGNSSEINVYRKDDDRIIAKFEDITSNNSYRILLNNLSDNESIDTFDLKILGSPVEFDHIVDPVYKSSRVISFYQELADKYTCYWYAFNSDFGVWTPGNCMNLADSNWETQENNRFFYYFNYSIPDGYQNASLIFKTTYGTFSVAINQSCIDFGNRTGGMLNLRASNALSSLPNDLMTIECLNGTSATNGWNKRSSGYGLNNDYTNISVFYSRVISPTPSGREFFEEGIGWSANMTAYYVYGNGNTLYSVYQAINNPRFMNYSYNTGDNGQILYTIFIPLIINGSMIFESGFNGANGTCTGEPGKANTINLKHQIFVETTGSLILDPGINIKYANPAFINISNFTYLRSIGIVNRSSIIYEKECYITHTSQNDNLHGLNISISNSKPQMGDYNNALYFNSENKSNSIELNRFYFANNAIIISYLNSTNYTQLDSLYTPGISHNIFGFIGIGIFGTNGGIYNITNNLFFKIAQVGLAVSGADNLYINSNTFVGIGYGYGTSDLNTRGIVSNIPNTKSIQNNLFVTLKTPFNQSVSTGSYNGFYNTYTTQGSNQVTNGFYPFSPFYGAQDPEDYYYQILTNFIDAGSNLATVLGLSSHNTMVTRTDSDQVDIGYHYFGQPDANVFNMSLITPYNFTDTYYVNRFSFFNVSVNVTCITGTCGYVDVSLIRTSLFSNWSNLFQDHNYSTFISKGIVNDSSNNFYVLTRRYNETEKVYQIGVLKIITGGNQSWNQTYVIKNYSSTSVSGIAVDSNNSVYISGTLQLINITSGDELNGTFWHVEKYYSNGSFAWNVTKNYSYLDEPYSIAVNPISGNLYVSGKTFYNSSDSFFTVIYNTTNGSYINNITNDFSVNYSDSIVASTYDSSGNFYVVGNMETSEFYSVIKLAKYNSANTLLWNVTYNKSFTVSGLYSASSITLDSSGNIYVAGYEAGSDYNNVLYLKFDNNGNLLYNQTYDTLSNNLVSGIGISNDNSIFIGASTAEKYPPYSYHFHPLKFNSTGSLVWEGDYDRGIIGGLAYTSGDNVVVTGRAEDPNVGGNTGVLTIEFNSNYERELIPTTSSSSPFYTNKSSNPFTTLNPLVEGQGEVVTFYVNATGTYGLHYFHFFGNLSSQPSNSEISNSWKVYIEDPHYPLIWFVNTTPEDFSTFSNRSFEINISIVESDLTGVKFNWNTTNFTIYNGSLLFMMNFNNRSSLSENSTVAIDVSNYNKKGYIQGGDIWNDSGKFEGGMKFDGVNDYINFSNIAAAYPISVAYWVKTDISKDGVQFGLNHTNIWMAGGFSTSNYLTGINNIGAAGASFINNNWNQITVVQNSATNVTVYVNGKDATAATGTLWSAGNGSAIGRRIGGSSPSYFNGTIDEFRIWNRSLSSTEVNELYMINLAKINSTLWYLYVNQTQNYTTGLEPASYSYRAYADYYTTNVNSTEERHVNLGKQIGTKIICSSSNIYINRYDIFNISVNVTCFTGNCSYTNVTMYANGTISKTVGASPFYLTMPNTNPNITKTPLVAGQTETINFTLNATGIVGSNWSIFNYVNLTTEPSFSNKSSVCTAYISSLSCPGGMAGSGTLADPCLVTTCVQLQNISVNLNLSYALSNDIDCYESVNWNGGLGFMPLGNTSDKFNATLDGRNNSIWSLSINRNNMDYVGLIGYIDSDRVNISSLGLVQLNITGRDYTGGLFGYKIAGYINGVFTMGNVNGRNQTGGLGGWVERNLTDSFSHANVNGTGFIGGLVGMAEDANITNCYAAGNVTAKDYAGGLIGIMQTGTFAPTVRNSFSTGNVTATSATKGGFLGFLSAGTLTGVYWNNRTYSFNCYSAGSTGCTIIQNNQSYFYKIQNSPMSTWSYPPWGYDCNMSGLPYLKWYTSGFSCFGYTTPQIGINILYPPGNVTVRQNSIFNVSVNITCLAGFCGIVNVTLDPEITPSRLWNSSTLANTLKSVDRDSLGNIYVGGYYYNSTTFNKDSHIIKYNSTGSVILNSSFKFSNGEISSISSDSFGNLSAVSYYTLQRYNSTLGLLWNVSSREYIYNDVVTDSLGNSYIAGYKKLGVIMAAKFNSAGINIWNLSISGLSNSTSFSLYGVTYIGSTNSVYLTGTLDGNITTLRVNATNGSLIWRQNFSFINQSLSTGYDLQNDSAGNLYIISYNYNATISNLFGLHKYDSNGNLIWNKSNNEDLETYPSNFRHMDVDSSGNIFISGFKSSGIDVFTIRKYNNTGSLLWEIDDDLGKSDFSPDIVLDTIGNFYVAGQNDYGKDLIIKYGYGDNNSYSKGIIPTTTGATPFYLTSPVTNPNSTISLSSGESNVINFFVNATGLGIDGETYTFFSYANLSSILNIVNVSRSWNVSIVGSGTTNINSCRVLNIHNQTYYVTQNIIDNTFTGACLNITAINVTVNCQNYLINSSQSAIGIYTNQWNSTIINCKVDVGQSAGGVGIRLDNSNNSVVLNSTLYQQYIGLFINRSSYVFIYNVTSNVSTYGAASGYDAIYLSESHHNYISNSSGISTLNKGIYLQNSNNNTLENLYSQSSSNSSLSLTNSNFTNLIKNIVVGNNSYNQGRIYSLSVAQSSHNNNFTKLTVSGNYSINIEDSYSVIIQDCFNISSELVDVNLSRTNKISNVTIINCTYYKGKEDVAPTSTLLLREWYYQAYVNDTTGRNVVNVSIDSYDKNMTRDQLTFTNQTGNTPVVLLNEYFNNGTRIFSSNHSIFVINSSYTTLIIPYNVSLSLNKKNNRYMFDIRNSSVNFTDPTQISGITATGNSTYINVTSLDYEGELSSFIDFDRSVIAWWTFDKVTTAFDVTDFFGRINLTNKLGTMNQTNPGALGRGFSFNSSYLQSPSFGIESNSGNITLSFWYKGDRNLTNYFSIFGDASQGVCATGGNFTWIYRGPATDYFTWQYCTGAAAQADLTSGASSLATCNITWCHVVMTLDTNNKRLYTWINGALNSVDTTANTILLNTAKRVKYVGAYSTGSYHMNGTLDDFIIFNRSLESIEIQTLYANQSQNYISRNFSSLADGTYFYRAYSQDKSGNINMTEERNIVVLTSLGTVVTSCVNISSSDATYTLTANISSTSTCINITGNNNIFNCNGNNITYGTGGSGGYGVWVAGNLTTIKNCTIGEGVATGNSKYAIYFADSHNSTIIYNNVTTSGTYAYPLYLYRCNNASVRENKFRATGAAVYGIYNNYVTAGYSQSNTFQYNVVDTTSTSSFAPYYQIYALDSILRYNNFTSANTMGIFMLCNTLNRCNLTLGPDNYVDNRPVNYTTEINNLYINSINYSAYGQVIFANMKNLTIRDSFLYRNGLSVYNITDSNINNVTIIGKGHGIIANNLNGVNITNNRIEINGAYPRGLYMYTSNDNNITGNNVTSLTGSSSFYQLSLDSSARNNLTDNNFSSNSASNGAYIFGSDNYLVNTNFYVAGNAHGIDHYYNSFRTRIENSSILVKAAAGQAYYGIYFRGYLTYNSTLTLVNTKVNSSYTNDLFVTPTQGNSSWIEFINVTINESDMNLNCNYSVNVSVKWDADVNVSDTSGQLANAWVNFSYFNGSDVDRMVTDSGGIARFNITEYIQSNLSGKYYLPLYTLNVSKTTYSQYDNNTINASNNQVIHVRLGSSNSPPDNVIVSINSTNGINKTLEDLYCFANITDPNSGDVLNVNVKWYENGILNLSKDYNNSYARGTLFIAKMDNGNTTKWDNWSCGIRVFDGSLYSNMVNTTINVTINNTPPVVNLLTPLNENITSNRTPVFTWQGVDDDGDVMTYEINISRIRNVGSACVDSDRYVVNTTLYYNTSYFPRNYLKCLYDNGDKYRWTVRASDTDGVFGAWNSTSRNISITSVIALSMPVQWVQWGVQNTTYIDNTSDNSPVPLILKNDGNVETNITANFTDLWSLQPNPSKYYQFKVRNLTYGCFDYPNSLWNWTNATSTDLSMITRLNFTSGYQSRCDNATIDLWIEVPSSEPAGNKMSNITFTGRMGELY